MRGPHPNHVEASIPFYTRAPGRGASQDFSLKQRGLISFRGLHGGIIRGFLSIRDDTCMTLVEQEPCPIENLKSV